MILPKADVLLKKAESEGIFEVFDPKILEDAEESYQGGMQEEGSAAKVPPLIWNREKYIDTYAPKIKKSSQILPVQWKCKPSEC